MENGFFKWVWRFNALIIAASATLVLGILGWEVTSDLRRNVFPTQTTDTLLLTPEATSGAEPSSIPLNRTFGLPNRLSQSGLYALPIYVEQTYTNRGISKDSRGNMVNYRIVETNTQTSRLLFPENGRLIVETRQLSHRSPRGETVIVGHLLQVIEVDTNGDTRLSRQDTSALYLVDPDWQGAVKVVDGVTRVLASEAVSGTETDIIYTVADQSYAMRIATPSGATISEQTFRAEK